MIVLTIHPSECQVLFKLIYWFDPSNQWALLWNFVIEEADQFNTTNTWHVRSSNVNFYLTIRNPGWKLSKCSSLRRKCPNSVPYYFGLYFPAFGMNRYRVFLRIQSECRKMQTRITSNTETFHAVLIFDALVTLVVPINFIWGSFMLANSIKVHYFVNFVCYP